MRDGEPNIYGALATMRNGQTQLQWSRVQMFLVFNTIAIPIVLGTGQPEGVKIALSSVGLVAHFALFVAALRGDKWIKYWDARMVELERLDQEEAHANGTRVKVFDHPDFAPTRQRGVTSRKIFAPIGIAFMFGRLEEAIRHGILYYVQ